MTAPQQLWQQYHAAVQMGKTDLAQQLLKQLGNFKANPAPRSGGCGKCKSRFY
jgi:hypothetical protein